MLRSVLCLCAYTSFGFANHVAENEPKKNLIHLAFFISVKETKQPPFKKSNIYTQPIS